MHPQVDTFLLKAKQWKGEMTALRAIVLQCGLQEDFKWYQPVYTYNGTNLLIISGFKEYCVLSFFKGALLDDPHSILQKPGANTQSARVIRFTQLSDINRLAPVIKAYIKQAMEAEKAGRKVALKKITERAVPEELLHYFKQDGALKRSFEALTPGRQRLYLIHFSQPKQSKTRQARIEKCIPLILAGKGLNDDYKAKGRQ